MWTQNMRNNNFKNTYILQEKSTVLFVKKIFNLFISTAVSVI